MKINMIPYGRKCVVFLVVCVCLLIFITYGEIGNGTLIAPFNNYSFNERKEIQTSSREPLNISRKPNIRSEKNNTLILTREPLNDSRNSNTKLWRNKPLMSNRNPLNDSRDWTILMTVNNGYLDFFRNWLWHFKKLNLSTPLIVVAQDDLVYKELINSDVSILGNITVDRSVYVSINSSVNFQTQQFNMLVGKRPHHILDNLERGINILYIDTDTVWLQDPFQYFTGDYDLWVQLDQGVSYCTGFMAVRTGANTLELIRAWRDRMIDLQNRMDDQNGFNGMVHNHESKVRIKGLDTKRFPDGSQYFSNYNDKQREDAVVVHNNCIIGHASKLERFKHMKLWYEGKLNGTKLHD